MTNPNPNVTAGAALSEYSATIAEYKRRGETLIREPLAELQQARELIAQLQAALYKWQKLGNTFMLPDSPLGKSKLFRRIRLVWRDKVDKFFFQGIENGRMLGRWQGALSLLAARKRINALRKEIVEARQDLKSESVRCESFAQLARQQSDDLIRLTAERDAFIVKLSLSREQSDSWKTAYLEARDLHEALGQELRQCQRERDELRARLNAVRRAAGDV